MEPDTELYCFGADETFEHFILDCPRFEVTSLEHFCGRDFRYDGWTVSEIIRFASLPSVVQTAQPQPTEMEDDDLESAEATGMEDDDLENTGSSQDEPITDSTSDEENSIFIF